MKIFLRFYHQDHFEMDIWEDDRENKVQNDPARKTNLKSIMVWTYLHLCERNDIKIIYT